MELLIGASLAVGVALIAAAAGFDRDRAFYPVVLVVVASYYDLFALIGGSLPALGIETAGLALFFGLAIIGFRTNLWLVAAALAGHGVFDLVHPQLIVNPGVPGWWPPFCMAYDVSAGAALALRLLSARLPVRPASPSVGRDRSRIPSPALRRLERAHRLGQACTVDHVRRPTPLLAWKRREAACEPA
jgi:hypothetical protein